MLLPLSLILALFAGFGAAQFNFFENIFQGQGQQQQQQQFHQQGHGHGGQHPEAPSDSEWYQRVWSDTFCFKYLCPNSLACVSVPEHCPCQHPDVEEKMELGAGALVCASKGGYKAGEMARKIELARKGLL